MSAARAVDECRICGGVDLRPVLSLGETPLANSFVRPERANAQEPRFPLEVTRCGRCELVQLTVVVDPDVLFRDYLYSSSASRPILDHFSALATEIRRAYAPAGALVVEIGSNDGVLLRPLSAVGLRPLGIEPATNLAAQANNAGLETWNEFFSMAIAERVRSERGPAAVVVANNVLAHIDDIRGVAQAVGALLGDRGVFIAEVPYLRHLIERVEYDTIYHEHLSYFHVAPLLQLFAGADLELFHLEHVPVHGGSIRIFATRTGTRAISPELASTLRAERDLGLGDAAPYRVFADRVVRQREQLREMLAERKARGQRLAGYGAAAKGNTLLNYCGIDVQTLDYVADSTPLKHGLLTPGTHIPVRPESEIERDPKPDALLLLAWNYADAIVARNDAYLRSGGVFIHPIPSPRIMQ